jgi:polysaccharide export outer membrane protein
MIFVNRAPNFYIYGEVQKPGVFRLERGMTVMQALATGGGLTPKGTRRGLQVHRRGSDGKILIIEPKLDDPILADDVIYVRESIF